MHNCGWIFLQFPVRWSKVELQPGRKPVFHSKSTFWPQSCSWVMFQSRFLPFWWRCMFCICLLCEHRTWLGILLCLHWSLGRGSGTGVHLIHLSLVGMGLNLTLSCHPPNPLCLAHFISAWPNNFKSNLLIWTLYGTEGLPMKNQLLLQGNSCVPTGIGN